jgi:hypothetical protein
LRILKTSKFPGGEARTTAGGFEATRGKSTADFISKIEGSLPELEESENWLELLTESGFWRIEGDIRQHRKKHQSKIEDFEAFSSSFILFYPFAYEREQTTR